MAITNRLAKLIEKGNLTTSLVFRQEDVELLRWIEQERGGIDYSSFIRQVLYEAMEAMVVNNHSPSTSFSLADIQRVVRDELDARDLAVVAQSGNGQKKEGSPLIEEVDEQLKTQILNMF